MDIVWVLMLSVCSTNQCVTQTISSYQNEEQCLVIKNEHETIPPDGYWKSINYICKPENSIKI
tara:strand:- start:72 stop:260 length:189 start_codon:yes stop_codon:yes gene_type:complete